MSLSNSRLAYTDCAELLNAALADPRGARIDFTLRTDAEHFMARCHQCRALDRRENRAIHPHGHPLHGRSVWDVLKCSIRPGTLDGAGCWWLYVIRHAIDLTGFQRLSELEPAIEEASLAQPSPQLLLAAPPVLGIKRRA